MATAYTSDKILHDLFGCEGYNKWFSGDLLGDEDAALNTPSSSKDSLEKENICELAPLSFEDFQSYLAATVDEAVNQEVPNIMIDSENSLIASTEINSEGIHRKFAEPKTDKEVSQARESAIPAKIRQDTTYCMQMWDAWASFRNGRPGTSTSYVPALLQLAKDPLNLQHWLSSFCLEARKKNGSEFSPNSLHHIICGLMRYIHHHGNPSLDLFKEPAYTQFRQTLDSEMKRLQGKGLGSSCKQADPLTEQVEEILWQKGYLGDHSPQVLVTQ